MLGLGRCWHVAAKTGHQSSFYPSFARAAVPQSICVEDFLHVGARIDFLLQLQPQMC